MLLILMRKFKSRFWLTTFFTDLFALCNFYSIRLLFTVNITNYLLRIALSVCFGVQDSGGVAAASYLRDFSTEPKVTEITMETFNFKCLLQVHLFFRKVFQGRYSVQSDSFRKWNFQFIDNWILFIAYLQFLPT